MNTNQTREQLAVVLAGGDPVTDLDCLDADAILAENVVIKRADLPEVVEEGEYLHVDGRSYDKGHVDAEKRRRLAMRDLALAEYLDAKEAREAEQEAEQEAKLTKRRDELADEMYRRIFGREPHKDLRGFKSRSLATQAAVQIIIEEQDKLAEAQEAQA